MHIHFLDPYRPRHSVIHRLDPRVKFVLALAFILTTALTPLRAWAIYLLLFSITLSLAIASELGVRYVLARAALALPFVLAALPLLFTTPGTAWLNTPLGNISPAGLERFASLACKSWLSVQIAILLTATTAFPDLLTAMRAMKLPRLLVAIFGMMWRYMFVLADEAMRLMRARAARSGQAGPPGTKTGGRLIWRAQVAGGLAGNLFVRAFERGDRIYAAMASRGYDGEVRALVQPPLAAAQWRVVAGGLLLCGMILILSFLF